MSRLVIDARESGTSTGRYVDKLIAYLQTLHPAFEVVLLTKPSRVASLQKAAPGFRVMPTPYREFSFGEQLGFKRQLNALKPDVVHFGMTQQPILYRGRVITTIHDLTTLRFNNPAKFWPVFKFKQLVYRRVVKHAAKKSAAILTGSRFVKEDLMRFSRVNQDKVTVTYEAADPIAQPAKPIADLAGKQFIVYVGRPMPHKNLWRLIEAFARLKADYPQLILVLAGREDANYRRIAKKVQKKHIKNVVFTGFVSEGSLRWLYENCAAYVFPSLSEGFGLPGLEAMLHGAPVISSSSTCLPEIYGAAAHYFNPLDVASIATAINEVLADDSLRQALINAGKVQAAAYSWQRMAEQTLAVYTKILKQ